MERKLDIHIRDRELMCRVVSEGIGALVSREFMQDHYVADVDSYPEELIIYLKEKYSAKVTILDDFRGQSRKHLAALSSDEK